MTVRLATQSRSAYSYGLLIRHILEGALQTSAEQEIVYRDQRRYSYAKLYDRVRQLGRMLHNAGVRPGDTVAIMDWDSNRYLEAYFAVPMMGAVLQTVNVRLTSEQIAYCVDSTGASVLLVHKDFVPIAGAIASAVPNVGHYILIADGDARADFAGYGEYEALLAASAPDFHFSDFDENALATTFHTSGTTGKPKGVQFSHRQLVLHSLALMAALGTQPPGQNLTRNDVYMPLTPMFHVHAWGMPYVATMAGVKQVYPGRYHPEAILDLKRSEGVTFSHCVPTVVQMIVDQSVTEDVSLEPWKMMIGGSALSPTIQENGRRRGVSLFSGYGMSESGPLISLARADGHDSEALRQAGKPLPLVHVRIVDGDDAHQSHDGQISGEVVVRSPWLTAGYLADLDATDELWRNRWLHTQDVGSVGPDGTITVWDRLKDVIKSGGEWVASAEIEALLRRHPAVAEAAIIAIHDEKWGERPYAYVSMTEGSPPLTFTEMRSFLSGFVAQGTIGKIALPDGITVLDRLPTTSVGKFDKRALRLLHNGI